MTQEELKKIAMRYAQDELKDNHSAVEDVVAAAFMDGANYADAHPHWISVEDELPKESDYYLCVIGSTQEVLWYNEGIEEWYEVYATKEAYLDIEDLTARVTHWMPLPAPPHHIIDVNKMIKKGGKK